MSENKSLEIKTNKLVEELISIGIEELESRQEMALLVLNPDVEADANSKCSENQGCNVAKGCGTTTTA